MPSVVQPPSVRERVGGRWAVSLRTYVVFCGLTAAIVVVRPSDFMAGVPLGSGQSLELLIAQCALIGAGLLLADRTILRNRRLRPVPIWVVFAVSGAAGALRIVPSAVFAPDALAAYSTGRPVASVAAFFAMIALNALTCPVLAYLFATRDWYVTERARLLGLEVEAEGQRLRAIGALDAMRDLATRAINREVRSAQTSARAALDAEHDPVLAADALLAAARGSVRPLGHALAGALDVSGARVHVSITAVIAAFLRRHPLPIAVPLAIFTIVIVPRIYLLLPPLEATVMAGLALVGVVVTFLAVRPVVRHLPAYAIPIAVAACVVAVIPAAIARDAFSDSGILRPIANLTLPLFTALFATGMVLAASDTAVELLNSLRAPLRRAEVERLAIDRARVDLERELGRHLHASVQSGLIAASYAIQDAVARGDLEAQEAALRAARDLLDARIDMGDGTAATESQVDLCAAVEREWATIITVHWEPAPPIEANTRDVVLLLRECLSNAVIHGHARHATIRIGTADTALLIEVEDDGVGPTGGGTGLGSAVLDDLTHGAWQLTGAPGAAGSIVRARIERSA